MEYGRSTSQFKFQSTLPLRRATTKDAAVTWVKGFQSTLPLRRATASSEQHDLCGYISIHAPLAESDHIVYYDTCDRSISIHAPLAESDVPQWFGYVFFAISIHAPLAESDLPLVVKPIPPCHFNPRSPCGERQAQGIPTDSRRLFQSTLPLRRATRAGLVVWLDCLFQSTLPLRRATCLIVDPPSISIISIHAPLAESDRQTCATATTAPYFNPRSPCGERLA